jgi:hypothetical protein
MSLVVVGVPEITPVEAPMDSGEIEPVASANV